jgi:hypothetical protein
MGDPALLSQLRDKITLANVLSTACLVAVLGAGTAVALPGRDSVRSNDINDGAIRAKDLQENAVKSQHLGNGAVEPDKLRKVPAARISNPQEGCAAQQVANGGQGESMRFATEEFDAGGLHPDSPPCADPSPRLFAPRGGVYEVGAAVHWPADASGARTLSLLLNGETVIARETRTAAASGETLQTIATTRRLNFDDRVEAVAEQTSGGPLQLAGGQDNNYLTLAWVGG